MPEPQDQPLNDTTTNEDEAPEVIAHQSEEDPWCAIYSCGALKPD
jgi:hypothetical protein